MLLWVCVFHPYGPIVDGIICGNMRSEGARKMRVSALRNAKPVE